MRTGFLTLVFVALLMFAGSALAAPITVDFTALGDNTVDITAQNTPAGITLNGVNMQFDTYGDTRDFASADRLGIYGVSHNGPINLSFNTGIAGTVGTSVRGLSLDFSLEGVTGPVPDDNGSALMAYVSTADGSVGDTAIVSGIYTPYDAAIPGLGSVTGHLVYDGIAFDQATIWFAFPTDGYDIPLFTVSNISYDVVPEPATMSLLAIGGIAMLRRKLIGQHR